MPHLVTGLLLAPIGILLMVSCLIAILSRRLGLPYVVGLVAAGFLIALLPNSPRVPLSGDLVFNLLLPPLVFEAALQLDWPRFRAELPLTLTLAFAGVAIAAATMAAGMHWLIGWSWIGAGLFGVLIAATDPVSVIASFRALDCAPRLSMVVEAESLLNDGFAAVGFALLSQVAVSGTASAVSIVPDFAWTLGGGVAIGLLVSATILVIVGRTDDPLVEISLTTLAAYGSFLLAQHFGASGIISALAAGLLVGNAGPRFLSTVGRDRVHWAWEYFAFLANSFVFILMGMSVAHQPLHRLGLDAAAAAIFLMLAGRALSVYPLSALFIQSRWNVSAKVQHALFWGGLRGALALALSLAIPTSVPERGAIILTAFLAVAFSILVQGLTIPWFIRRLGLSATSEDRTVAAQQR